MDEAKYTRPVVGSWGSIELAPRNGEIFIGISRLGGAVIVRGEAEGFFEDDTGIELHDLKGWMPIPPPKEEY